MYGQKQVSLQTKPTPQYARGYFSNTVDATRKKALEGEIKEAEKAMKAHRAARVPLQKADEAAEKEKKEADEAKNDTVHAANRVVGPLAVGEPCNQLHDQVDVDDTVIERRERARHVFLVGGVAVT